MRIRTFLTLTTMLFLSGAMTSSASAQTPSASAVASPAAGEWRVTDVREVAIDGSPVALSPDGRWIAGIGPEGVDICAWNVETGESTCADTGVRPFPFSIAWAPDSSALVFVDGDPVLHEPNGVWIFTVGTGEVTSLADAALMHQQPVWTADGETVIFLGADVDPERASVYTVDRDGGQVERLPVPAVGIQAVIPIRDGRLAIATGADSSLQMWEIGLDGTGLERTTLPIELGQDMPVQYADRSHDGRYLALASPEDQGDGPLVYRRFVLGMTTGEIVPQQTPDVSVQMFGPDHWTDAPASIVLGRDDTGDPLELFEVEPSTGAARPIPGGSFDGEVTYWTLTFGVDGQVMAATHRTAWLMTLKRS